MSVLIEAPCYPQEIEQLCRDLQMKVRSLQEDIRVSTDNRKIAGWEAQIVIYERTLEWLPRAATIPVAWVRFIAPEGRRNNLSLIRELMRVRLPGVADNCYNRVLRFHKCRLDTNNPLEIARLRVHMEKPNHQEPHIEEDPSVRLKPARIRPNDYFSLVPEEEWARLFAAGLILPDYS